MAYSKDVRESVLIAAARHCCVCHRYRGLRVEVHHIIPESKGGKSDFDNAIALCFDCHCDAGHYNDRHPKGSKLSASELIRARDLWYKMVVENRIAQPDESDILFHFRYFICNSTPEAIKLYSGDLSALPFSNGLLVHNEVHDFVRSIDISRNSSTYLTKDCYTDIQDYLDRYPDATLVNKADTEDPYFAGRRIPTKAELLSMKPYVSLIEQIMIDSPQEPSTYSKVLISANLCGSGMGNNVFEESICFRSTSFVFLVATNVSSRPLRLVKLEGSLHDAANAFRPFNDKSQERPYSFNFPETLVRPDESIVVPISLLLSPLEHLNTNRVHLDSREQSAGEWHDHGRVDGLHDASDKFFLIGPVIRPTLVKIQVGPSLQSCFVHPFNLECLYTLSVHWEAGCCPHLFFDRSDGMITYESSLFSREPGATAIENVIVPTGVNGITIAELEEEVTQIESIKIDGRLIQSDLTMFKGDVLRFEVKPGDHITIVGKYLARATDVSHARVFERNEAIVLFMADRLKTWSIKGEALQNNIQDVSL
jgi:hypothetical protein